MKAPHPSLERLFRMAAAPAQRALAWRAQGDALAALDPAVDDRASASDARIEALLGEPQVGSVLASPLARLAAVAHGAETDAALPGRQRLPVGPQSASALGRAAAPSMQAQVAPRQPAATPLLRRPGAMAPAGAAAGWPVGARLLPSSRLGAALPVAPAAAALPPAGLRSAARAGVTAGAGQAIDAPEAAARFEARAAGAGLAAVWARAVELRPMPGTAPLSADPTETGAAGFSGAARNSDAIERDPDAAVAPQHVERALARLAAEPPSPAAATRERRAPAAAPALVAGRQVPPPPTAAVARPATAAMAAAARALPGAPGSPLQAARVGGFRGLAALGRVAGPVSSPAAAAQPVAIPGAARPQPAALDPQAVIDHVESALREQAARGGVSIDGIEP